MTFISKMYQNRLILMDLIKHDFNNRYMGSHLGLVWAFLQPVMMVFIYWFVFTYGLRASEVNNDVPFILWLLAGLVPWFLFNDAVLSSSRSIVDQPFLVKKIVFELSLLPLVKIGSAILVNLGFWVLLFVGLILYGYYPDLMWLQVFYYMLCLCVLLLALGLLLSGVTVFALDVSQLLVIVMQILFWITPLLWNQDTLPKNLSWIIALNPVAYVVNGVRDSLIDHAPFWEHYYLMLYFWGLTSVLLYTGNRLFNKLRPHFADVL